jgi:4-hydroxybenzoate polyprenyltransferase
MNQTGIAVNSNLEAGSLPQSAGNRWWIYQRERFPLAGHTPVIAAFSLAAVGYSILERGSSTLPGTRPIVVAFTCSFLFFLQLRLADEFKDFEEDRLYRPYRPVPRGLITLRELAFVWAVSILLQLLSALWLSPRLLPLLVAVWIYQLLMSREFFCRDWLKRHPVAYMMSHMVIMPLIFLFASACDWIPAGYTWPKQGLLWMMGVNFFVGMVIEIGRKIRAPSDEEHGVETYSLLWGRVAAVFAWLALMAASAVAAYPAARSIQFAQIEFVLVPVIASSVFTGVAFLMHNQTGGGKRIETVSGMWALLMYLGMGPLPLWLHFYGGRR